jgi:hypothetical protein
VRTCFFHGYKACIVRTAPAVQTAALNVSQGFYPWQSIFVRKAISTPGITRNPWHKRKLETAHAMHWHFNFKTYIFSLSIILFSRLDVSQGYNPWQIIKISKVLVSTFPGKSIHFPGMCAPVKKPWQVTRFLVVSQHKFFFLFQESIQVLLSGKVIYRILTHHRRRLWKIFQ